MLPNHSPLVIAEQFGTLESIFPGRIDLGLGRAPGGDRQTAYALRRGLDSSGDTFPRDVVELQSYFAPAAPGQVVRAIPGAGLEVPVYLLGSSDFSAQLAAQLGLPFAFASHFAPDHLEVALELYRRHFQPSAQLAQPHVIVAANVVAADIDAEARRLFTSLEQMFLGLVRGTRTEMPPPVESMAGRWSGAEEMQARRMLRCSAVGSAATIRRELEDLVAWTEADEIMVTAQIFDHAARLRSFEIAADVLAAMAGVENAVGSTLSGAAKICSE